VLVAILPIDSVEPTPFQRDLSDAHHRKLADVLERTGKGFICYERNAKFAGGAGKFNTDKVKQEDLASVGGAPDEAD
jgi:hypothetical protein